MDSALAKAKPLCRRKQEVGAIILISIENFPREENCIAFVRPALGTAPVLGQIDASAL